MTEFSIASFNVKNLIGAEQEYYKYEQYTVEEHAWKQAWLADQLHNLSADIVCFQEIFDQGALQAVIDECDQMGLEANETSCLTRANATPAKPFSANWPITPTPRPNSPLHQTSTTAVPANGARAWPCCPALDL